MAHFDLPSGLSGCELAPIGARGEVAGDVATVDNVFEASTTITMPTAALSVTATYAAALSADNETHENECLKIFPNPARNSLNIETSEASKINFFNVAGQMSYIVKKSL